MTTKEKERVQLLTIALTPEFEEDLRATQGAYTTRSRAIRDAVKLLARVLRGEVDVVQK